MTVPHVGTRMLTFFSGLLQPQCLSIMLYICSHDVTKKNILALNYWIQKCGLQMRITYFCLKVKTPKKNPNKTLFLFNDPRLLLFFFFFKIVFLAFSSFYLSNFIHKCVKICVNERFSFAEIIHPPVRWSISRR